MPGDRGRLMPGSRSVLGRLVSSACRQRGGWYYSGSYRQTTITDRQLDTKVIARQTAVGKSWQAVVARLSTQ